MAVNSSSPFNHSTAARHSTADYEDFDPTVHGLNRLNDKVKITKNNFEGETGRITRFTPKMMYIKLDRSGQVILRNGGSIFNSSAEKRAAMGHRSTPSLQSKLENNRLTDILTALVLHVEWSGLGPRDDLAQATIARRFEDIIREFEEVKLE